MNSLDHFFIIYSWQWTIWTSGGCLWIMKSIVSTHSRIWSSFYLWQNVGLKFTRMVWLHLQWSSLIMIVYLGVGCAVNRLGYLWDCSLVYAWMRRSVGVFQNAIWIVCSWTGFFRSCLHVLALQHPTYVEKKEFLLDIFCINSNHSFVKKWVIRNALKLV